MTKVRYQITEISKYFQSDYRLWWVSECPPGTEPDVNDYQVAQRQICMSLLDQLKSKITSSTSCDKSVVGMLLCCIHCPTAAKCVDVGVIVGLLARMVNSNHQQVN